MRWFSIISVSLVSKWIEGMWMVHLHTMRFQTIRSIKCVSSSTWLNLSQNRKRKVNVFVNAVSRGERSIVCMCTVYKLMNAFSHQFQFYIIEEYSCAMSCALQTNVHICTHHYCGQKAIATAATTATAAMAIANVQTELATRRAFEYACTTIWNLFWTMCHPFLLAWARSALSRLLRRWCCALFCCTVLCCAVYLSTCAVA